ncbi:MAG: hypothetical protein EPN72_07625 [Nevskiaceae bacterium]|nr:MAG: hypothetical protein EPN63_04985 [Nevskiaceae bacterium]TBR73030.1 MAG: hypothetical protein EPN72_07625 [Nevskiaceae bacterium]
MPQTSAAADVAATPAPWTLTGRGWILLIRLPPQQLDDPRFVPDPLRGRRHGRYALMMAVDYAHSPVGPYRELLYIPGRFDFADGRRYSITHIYVSTQTSVVSGRRNWGIPKQRCDFSVEAAPNGATHFAAQLDDGTAFAQLELRAHGPRLPFSSAIVPGIFKTLSQLHDGYQFTYRPTARGHVRLARVTGMAFDGRHFPDCAAGHVAACVEVTDFQMTFPVSTIIPTS